MARKSEFEEFLADLVEFPWWVSVIVGVVFFLVVRYGIPLLPFDFGMFSYVVETVGQVGSWFAVLFLLPAGLSIERRIRGRHLLDVNNTQDEFRRMDWRAFEELVEAYYRKLGYRVQRQREDGPDGGIDVRITNEQDQRFLVQCKQWRHSNVGVKTVRELLGVVVAERAAGGIVVTSNEFTNEAREFAEGVPIKLIDGEKLAHMMGDLLNEAQEISPDDLDDSTPLRCPACGSELVIRKANRGRHKGRSFYGCAA